MQSSTQRSRDIKIEMGFYKSSQRKHKGSNTGKKKSLSDHRWTSKRVRYGFS